MRVQRMNPCFQIGGLLGALLLQPGCLLSAEPMRPPPDTPDEPDLDGDGAMGEWDCDESDPAVNARAPEMCNGIDDDCDGRVDDEDDDVADAIEVFYDGDGDGYGTGAPQWSCSPGDSLALQSGDCNDLSASQHPGLEEEYYNGTSEACPAVDDCDADGDGAPCVGEMCPLCPEVEGVDCLDTDAAVFPGATETWYDGVDQNCDGADDCDADGDGWPSTGDGSGVCPEPAMDDCDDGSASAHPDAVDACGDGIDNDCNDVEPIVCRSSGRVVDVSASADRIWRNEDAANARFGERLAAGADFDGDGTPDIVVGASGWSSSRGAIALLPGSAGTFRSDLDDAILWTGSEILDRLGAELSLSPDLDGDGYDDLVTTMSAGGGDQSVVLFPGGFVPDDALEWSDARGVHRWEPTNSGDGFGSGIFAPGDITGDGIADLLIGARIDQSVAVYNGRLDVLPGTTNGAAPSVEWRIYGHDNQLFVGSANALGVGDLDGDGVNDVVIGASGNSVSFGGSSVSQAGSVFVFEGTALQGGNNLYTSDATAQVDGPTWDHAQFGGVVLAQLSDLDGDGRADLIAAAPNDSAEASGGGAVFGVGGVATLADLDGRNVSTADFSLFGGSEDADCGEALLAGPSGVALSIGCPGEDTVYWIFDTNPSGTGVLSESADVVLEGPADSNLGIALAHGAFGEGSESHLLLGAPGFGDGEADRGAVWVVFGSDHAGDGW